MQAGSAERSRQFEARNLTELNRSLRSLLYQQLRSILGRECLGPSYALSLLRIAELRWRRGTAVDGVTDRHEEFLLTGWRAHAEKACRLVRLVLEPVGCVGGDVHGRTGTRLLRRATE